MIINKKINKKQLKFNKKQYRKNIRAVGGMKQISIQYSVTPKIFENIRIFWVLKLTNFVYFFVFLDSEIDKLKMFELIRIFWV